MIPVLIPMTHSSGSALAITGGGSNWETVNRALLFVPWHQAMTDQWNTVRNNKIFPPDGYFGYFNIEPLLSSSALTDQYVSVVYPYNARSSWGAGDGAWVDAETVSLVTKHPIDVTGTILHDHVSMTEVERAFWPSYRATITGHGTFFGCNAGDLQAGTTFSEFQSWAQVGWPYDFVFALSRDSLFAVAEPGTFADMACGWHVLAIPWTKVPHVRQTLVSKYQLH